jgi:hypothetical protein
MKKSHLYSKLEFSIVFLLIGILFTTVSVIFIVFDFNIRNNWVESTGIISSVNHSSEKIEFTYNYNGYSYEFKSAFSARCAEILIMSVITVASVSLNATPCL